jgi:predicted DNA-binding transcriptional regulator YafY
MKDLRTDEMVRLFRQGEKTVKELAEMFGVSTRTVQRALRTAAENQAREVKQ